MAEASADVNGQPILIAEFEENEAKARLHYSKVEQIVQSRSETISLPTVVLAITGKARSGKSFLLNNFIHLLDYMEKNGCADGWEQSDVPIRGVHWARSKQTVTHGMWMWSRPLIVTRSNDSKVAVLLVDMQGTGDNKLGKSYNTLIMYLSLHLSTVQLFNIKDYVTSDDLELLKLCGDYMELRGVNSDYIFRSLVFVVRDYQAEEVYGEDDSIIEDMLHENTDEASKAIIKGISNAFKIVTSYQMPGPGDKVLKSSSGQNLKLKDVKPKFLDVVKKFVENVLYRDTRDNLDSQPTGKQLLSDVKRLHESLPELDPMTSSAEALKMVVLLDLFSQAELDLKDLRKELSKVWKLRYNYLFGHVLKSFDAKAVDVKKKFTESLAARKYSGSTFLRKQLEKLDAVQKYEREVLEKTIEDYDMIVFQAIALGFAATAAVGVGTVVGAKAVADAGGAMAFASGVKSAAASSMEMLWKSIRAADSETAKMLYDKIPVEGLIKLKCFWNAIDPENEASRQQLWDVLRNGKFATAKRYWREIFHGWEA